MTYFPNKIYKQATGPHTSHLITRRGSKMAANFVNFLIPIRADRITTVQPLFLLRSTVVSPPLKTAHTFSGALSGKKFSVLTESSILRRNLLSVPAVSMFSDNLMVHDLCVGSVAGVTALSLLLLWGEIAKRGIFDQKLNRKLVHISVGLVFMLFWPLFSDGPQAVVLAALIPGVNIIRMLLVGLGIWKDDAMVKSMSRYGDRRELLKGPLYYATTITLASFFYWRTSPVAIAAICTLCAGDGVADVVGRRFGKHKLPYNKDKSYEGSIAMATAGFLACLGYMRYFSMFGVVQETWGMVLGFLIVSLAATLVESLPISSELDDNLTVPLTSLLVGSLMF